ncbi:MAG: hypothetical protein IJN29_13560 [Akkermansia sp.]|nr:hypothetical protein [Akkermansia sp.]
MKLFLSFIVVYMSIVSAHPARFPLGENDFIQWDDAVTAAISFDFLTTSSLDIISIYGKPRTIGSYSEGSYVYYYYCPSNLPKLERLRQQVSDNEKDRMTIRLCFGFNENHQLISVEIQSFAVPEIQAQ